MFTKRLTSTFQSIFKAKMYFFLKKSLWRYLMLTFIFGFLKPINNWAGFYSFLIYFIGLMLILFPLQFISAKIMAKKLSFDADVEFDESGITVRHRNKDIVEHKDWTWVKAIDLRPDIIWLVLNERFPTGMGLPKDKLSNSEISFFEQKKKDKLDSRFS